MQSKILIYKFNNLCIAKIRIYPATFTEILPIRSENVVFFIKTPCIFPTDLYILYTYIYIRDISLEIKDDGW